MPLGGVMVEEAHGGEPVVYVVFGVELAQRESRAVVLLHQLDGARRIIDGDRSRGR